MTVSVGRAGGIVDGNVLGEARRPRRGSRVFVVKRRFLELFGSFKVGAGKGDGSWGLSRCGRLSVWISKAKGGGTKR